MTKKTASELSARSPTASERTVIEVAIHIKHESENEVNNGYFPLHEQWI